MHLEEIAGHAGLARQLARWHVQEWGHLYDGWDLEVAVAEFVAMDTPGRIPTTWIAFADDGRTSADVLGSVSLIADDDLPGYEHLSPWLASLYVVPRARGQGIGGVLVQRCLEQASGLGLARIHLFTAGQEAFYLARGWKTIDRTTARGEAVAVMAHDVP